MENKYRYALSSPLFLEAFFKTVDKEDASQDMSFDEYPEEKKHYFSSAGKNIMLDAFAEELKSVW